MMNPSRRWHREIPVDPVDLLKREHEMILDRLQMIEAVIGPPRRKQVAVSNPDRDTLRDLFRFFTGQMAVHYKREAALIAAVNRVAARRTQERGRFDSLLMEHRAMKADAAGIMKQLANHTVDPPAIRSFVRRFHKHILCGERILYVLADMRLTVEQKLRVGHRMLQV